MRRLAGPTIRGTARLGLLDDLIEEGAKLGRTYTPDAQPESGKFYRSDHFTMAKAGIPAISLTPGQDLFNGGVARADEFERTYTSKYYHQPDDEWSPNWDYSGMIADATLLHAIGCAEAAGHQHGTFVDALGALGELWIYAERAERP